jgi:hypothetical protein
MHTTLRLTIPGPSQFDQTSPEISTQGMLNDVSQEILETTNSENEEKERHSDLLESDLPW